MTLHIITHSVCQTEKLCSLKAESVTLPMCGSSPRALAHILIYLYLIVLDLPCLPFSCVGHWKLLLLYIVLLSSDSTTHTTLVDGSAEGFHNGSLHMSEMLM